MFADQAASIPIVIGVTGHRDLRREDEECLKGVVRQIFSDLQSIYPHSGFILLSPLAEGADRLVAGIAMERGCRLIVPLPMPRDEFAKDFESDASREEFAHLLSQAFRVFTLHPAKTGTYHEENSHDRREHLYNLATAYITTHCQILIALTDGKKGSHAEKAVSWQLEETPREYRRSLNLHDPTRVGLVYHVLTPRRKNTELPVASEYAVRSPKNGPADFFLGVLKEIDSCNRDIDEQLIKGHEQLQQSGAYLFPESKTDQIDDAGRSLRDWFARMDILAILLQKQAVRSFNYLFVMVFAGITCFEAYAHLWPGYPLYLLAFALLLLLANYLYYNAQKERLESRYLDYRTIAEGLRIQFFWQLTGIGQCVSDQYPHLQGSEMDWIRTAIRSIGLSVSSGNCHAHGSMEAPSAEILASIKEHWVADQRSYFAKAQMQNHRSHRTGHRLADIFFIATPLLALTLFIYHTAANPPVSHIHISIFIVALTLVLAALFEGYTDRRAFTAHARRYEWMEYLHGKSLERLDDELNKGNLGPSRGIIWRLGKEALQESANWHILHRERPMELPKG